VSCNWSEGKYPGSWEHRASRARSWFITGALLFAVVGILKAGDFNDPSEVAQLENWKFRETIEISGPNGPETQWVFEATYPKYKDSFPILVPASATKEQLDAALQAAAYAERWSEMRYYHYDPITGTPENSNPTSSSKGEQSATQTSYNVPVKAKSSSTDLAERVAAAEQRLTEVYTRLRARLDQSQKRLLKQDEIRWIAIKDSIPADDPRHAEEIEKRIQYLQNWH
jgi:hypothetical protein